MADTVTIASSLRSQGYLGATGNTPYQALNQAQQSMLNKIEPCPF